MTRGTPFGWRVAVILVIGFLAVASIAFALYFMGQGVERIAGVPQPQQLAAMARLLERTPADERARVCEAFHSAQLSLRVEHAAGTKTDLKPFWPTDGPRLTRYRAALGDRDFAAYAVPRKLFQHSFYSLLNAAEFRIALRDGGVLIVTSESAAWVNDFGMPIGFTLAILGVVTALGALIMLNREFRPVLRLAKAVEALDPSDPDARLPAISAGTREVRTLISAFDRQQTRVTALLRARASMIGGIQHDVRTFATRLRLRIEKLTDPQERVQAETDISDLVTLMDSALLATRHQAGQLDLELIDLSDLLDAEIRDRRAEGARADLTVSPAARQAQILGDRLALRRIVSNLVENGLRYGNSVHLSLNADRRSILIIVDDDGPGIPKAKRTALLEPFARLEPSRSRGTGGAGLGLAIVRTLVEAHEGTLAISDADMGSARLIVRMPLFRQPSKG
ncbi:MAG: ATP-binding protein [Alphaproteobacteria bacterium]